MVKQGLLEVRRPSVVIAFPARIAGKDAAIQFEQVPFIPMRAVLIGRSADVAIKHLYGSHLHRANDGALQHPASTAAPIEGLIEVLCLASAARFELALPP